MSGAVRAGHGSGGARAEERSVGRAEQRRPWQAAAGRTAGLLRPRGTLEAGSPRWAPSRGWGAVAGACLGGTGCQGGSMSRGHTSLPRTPGRQCPRPAGPAVVRGAQPPARVRCRPGPAAGVGVAERVLRAQAAGAPQQHGVPGLLPRRAAHRDRRGRRQGGAVPPGPGRPGGQGGRGPGGRSCGRPVPAPWLGHRGQAPAAAFSLACAGPPRCIWAGTASWVCVGRAPVSVPDGGSGPCASAAVERRGRCY